MKVLGAGLLSLAAVVGRAPAQSPAPAGAPAPTGAASAPPAGLRIGAIDMERVFKEYKKVEFTSNQLKNDAQLKQAELAKMLQEMQAIAKEMEGLAPGQPDFTAKETQLTKMRVELESERERAQHEFARREAQALAQIYREIQEMTAALAKTNNFHYIVKVSSEPVSGDDPNSVMAAMARSVIYSHPSLDITDSVVKYLNQRYEAAGGAAPTDPAAQPATATQPAAPRTPAAPGR